MENFSKILQVTNYVAGNSSLVGKIAYYVEELALKVVPKFEKVSAA